MTDLIVFIRPRRSNYVETVVQSVVVLSFLFGSSVHCPSMREYAFWMFSSRMESRLTFASTFFVRIIFSCSSFVQDRASGKGIANLTLCSIEDLLSPPLRYSVPTYSEIHFIVWTNMSACLFSLQ